MIHKFTHNTKTGEPLTGKMLYPWYHRLPLKSTKDPSSDRVFRKLADTYGYDEVKADMKSMTHEDFAFNYDLKVKS